jgi:hypothetical protein
VRNAVALGAVCADGSPGAYYFRKGNHAGSDHWVIVLGGGNPCTSASECTAKTITNPNGMSSYAWNGPQILIKGILSDQYSQNPDFFDANHVYLKQCSSDSFLGTRDASPASFGFAFKGDLIFRQVIADLATGISGTSLNQATHILLIGESSGSQGVIHHLDDLSAQFPQAFVAGVLDAGWAIEINPLVLTGNTPDAQAQLAYSLFSPALDNDCLVGQFQNPHRCLFPEVSYTSVTSPLIIRESEADAVRLQLKGVVSPYNAAELAYVQNYTAMLRASLQPLPLVYANTGNNHAISLYPGFSTIQIGGVSFSTYLGDWFFQRGGATQLFGF